MLSPLELRTTLGSGLMSFPVTDFDDEGEFDEKAYRGRLEWLSPYRAAALFVGGGTGEGFSLTPAEHGRVVRAAVEACGAATPIVASAAYSTRIAVEMARQAERAGAAGILLLPHYLTEAGQEGLARHVQAVCAGVRIGVVVYNRNVCRLTDDTLARLADTCPNLVGFKDGVGDIESLVTIRRRIGERLAYLGGLPTAEIFAEAYYGAGIPVYSSAVFNFIPDTAIEFHRAVVRGDRHATTRLLNDFFIPYIKIRNRGAGYAVAIVKAGATIVGRSAGPVRPPLVDCSDSEIEMLQNLINALKTKNAA